MNLFLIGKNLSWNILSREFSKKLYKHNYIFQSLHFSTTSYQHHEMKRWQTDGFTGIDGLHISSVNVPVILNPTDILVKVSAASVNPIDLAMIGGYGKDVMFTLKKLSEMSSGNINCDKPSTFPLTVGRDFTGEVIHMGHSVKNVLVKDKVWGISPPQRSGSHAEYLVIDSSCLCVKPDNISDIEAASIPYVALTCWSAAVFSGEMKPKNCFGDKVLILGASGGVGTFMTQLLTSWGAEVTGVCSENSFELVMSCGAQEVFDYKDHQTKMHLTSTPKFNLVIDASGQPDHRWTDSLLEWKNSSYVTLSSPLLTNIDNKGLGIGLLQSLGQVCEQNFLSVTKGKTVKWAFFMPNSHALTEVTKLVSSQQIKPCIGKVYPFSEVKDAFLNVQNSPTMGKTVISMISDDGATDSATKN